MVNATKRSCRIAAEKLLDIGGEKLSETFEKLASVK
jgi:hypothetical protein